MTARNGTYRSGTLHAASAGNKRRSFVKRKLILWSGLILLASALPVTVTGQPVTKIGTTAAKFLSIPVGARALGMGGAFVSLSDDASSMYWNPGGMARLTAREAMVYHADWVADIDFNYAGIVLPFERLGVLGFNLTMLSYGEMERTTEDQPDGTGDFFTAGSFAFGVSYARNLTDWFSIGVNAKYVQETIWNSSASGFAIDIGTLFTTPFPGVTFGAGVSNFGQKMQITGDDLLVQKDISPNKGNNPNINANLTTDRFDLPLNLRIGFSYEPVTNDDQRLIIALDAAHPNDNSESVNVGFEYSLLQRMVSLRGGYKALGVAESEERFTVGGGLRYEISTGVATRIDYAYEDFGRLQNAHTVTISVHF